MYRPLLSLAAIPLCAACVSGGGAPPSDPSEAGEPRDSHGAYAESPDGRTAMRAPAPEGARFRGAPSGAASGEGYDEAPGAPMEMEEDGAEALLPRTERPGLATHWGESRYSPTRSVSFFRDDPARPTDVVVLSYDDFAGVRAMTGRFPGERASIARLVGGALTVTLEDAAGRPLPAVDDGRRLVFAGEPGERYQIRVDNHTNRRFEVVATVDGLDVIDGGDGDPEKRGYLLDAWATVEIDGFRRSEDEVAAFRFGDVGGSYAKARGRGRDVGVIGIAAFAERGDRPYRDPREVELRRTADPFPARFSPPPPRPMVR